MCSLFGFGMPGLPELLIVTFVILILFGNRLPAVMRSLGQGITEFKKGVNSGADDVASKIESDENSSIES